MGTSKIRISRLLVLCTLCLFPSVLLAQGLTLGDAVYVDFGGGNTTTGNWNNMTSASGTITNAVTGNGVTTGIGFALPVRFNGINENGTTAPDAALGLPATATRDSFYGNDVTFNGLIIPNSQLVISGLDPATAYELTLFSSRMSVSDNRETQYDINGKEGLAETLFLDPANNTDKAVTSIAIWPTDAGEIIIDIQKGPNNTNSTGFFYLGALTLRVAENVGAIQPSPKVKATDVTRDVALAWTPAMTAETQDVYFGTDLDAVTNASSDNPLGVLVSKGQTDSTYTPEALLEYGQTYYWRVDEVNSTPNYTVTKGTVWSFTAEPYAYPITNLTVVASSEQTGAMAIATIDGSGLTENDEHSITLADMWMTTDAPPAWIQYQFDKEYKLYELWVWNSNQGVESYVGFGAKDVTVEYSVDGDTWTTLENVPEFAQASGFATYTADTVVNFGGVTAKYVKLTINTNWGGVKATGLSEVRFFYVPVQAREPDPTDGQADVAMDTILNWRPGREATSHTLYLSDDGGAVADGSAAAVAVTEHSYTPEPLDFATEYFWKVDEVGDGGIYEGNVWSFTTLEFATIDDFEAYNDSDNRIYDVWVDGYSDKSSGSTVGYIDSAAGTFGERTIVHGGTQSMPILYDNTASPYYSQAVRTFDTAQNWTVNGATSVSLYFRGSMPSFKETSSGTIFMNGIGADVWGTSDAFRFAYKSLNGNGSIVARVNSLYASDTWAKAGVMIRQSLEPGSTHAFMAKTPSGGNGASFQRRLVAAGDSTNNDSATAVGFPYWVKVQRTGTQFSAYTSPDGVTWTELGSAQTIAMTDPVMIGLAVCSHSASIVTGAEFSDVTISGTVTGGWQVAEIGLTQVEGNSPEPIYLTFKDSAGKSATVTYPDLAATTAIAWQQWLVPLSDLTTAGLKTTAIKSMTIGIGNKSNPSVGGTGTLFIDDIEFGKPLP